LPTSKANPMQSTPQASIFEGFSISIFDIELLAVKLHTANMDTKGVKNNFFMIKKLKLMNKNLRISTTNKIK
jgi:hypothetical protein